jgi:hypothetical protein
LVKVHEVMRGQAHDASQPVTLGAILRVAAKVGISEATELVGDEAKVGHEVGVGRFRDAPLKLAVLDSLLEKGRHAIAGLGVASKAR